MAKETDWECQYKEYVFMRDKNSRDKWSQNIVLHAKMKHLLGELELFTNSPFFVGTQWACIPIMIPEKVNIYVLCGW